ncbi:MAG: flagellar M-ring protein FliF [Azoarcus sp.]|jgi:flagellar M-ring protein FliF|nr:flagellar M-ring protein FliF [Azoarcus sp.]
MATAENTAGEIAAPPSADSLRGRLQQAVANIRALSQQQKIAAAAALALAIALIAGALLWNGKPEQAVLFSNFDERDGGEIVAALQQQNVPYSISGDGRAILVSAPVVHETRMRLAAAGLPRGGLVGFEIMDTQKLGISQFNEQVTFQRALEGELARTIQSISSVVGARVHLAMPKQTAFLRDDQKPTASVMVQMRAGRALDANQVAGIVHLVASSVPKMSDAGVAVVDQNGELLTREDPLRRSGLDPTQLRYIEEVESGLNRRIGNILTPMFGKGNFRAQVAADIDFNQVEQTAETYRPNPAPEQAVRSQQTTEQQNRDQGPQGVPGALTNQPPVPATAPITAPPVPPQTGAGGQQQSSSRSAVLNYELDRTIQHVKQALGQVKRISVAVVINHRSAQLPSGEMQALPISDEEITRIANLVREAVGYNATRGDTINVTSSPFAEPTGAPPPPPLWKDPEMIEMAKDGGKYLLPVIIILFAYFAIIRPLLRTVAPPPPREEPSIAEDEDEDEEGVDVELSAAAARSEDYETRLARAREMAREDPKSVAELIKQWMGAVEEGGHK